MFKIKKQTKLSGFTLIELLVVIAIIGILASVVLASLNNARAAARDASVASTLSSMRAQAEIYRSINGNYGSTGYASNCGVGTSNRIWNPNQASSDQVIIDSFLSLRALNENQVRCAVSATTFAFAARLNADPTRWWCVDSTGASRSIQTTGESLTSAWTSNGPNRVCPN